MNTWLTHEQRKTLDLLAGGEWTWQIAHETPSSASDTLEGSVVNALQPVFEQEWALRNSRLAPWRRPPRTVEEACGVLNAQRRALRMVLGVIVVPPTGKIDVLSCPETATFDKPSHVQYSTRQVAVVVANSDKHRYVHVTFTPVGIGLPKFPMSASSCSMCALPPIYMYVPSGVPKCSLSVCALPDHHVYKALADHTRQLVGGLLLDTILTKGLSEFDALLFGASQTTETQ